MKNLVFLRALELNDSDTIYKWRNNRLVTDPLGGNTYFVSSFREKEWIQDVILNDSKRITLAICINDHHLIGMVSLTSINLLNRNAEFSIIIGDPQHWGKGLGAEATILCLQHAFQELNLHRVYLTVREDNASALKLYSKLGFLKEGLLRDAIYKNNKFVNMLIMSILKDEFENK